MSYKKGHTPWSKGLTKRTDERVARIAKANKRPHPWVRKNSPFKRGEKHILWKGGRHMHEGYVVLSNMYDHPTANSRGRILEHRYVMEKHLGRNLKEYESVHHKNGVKDDNRIANLEIVLRKKHFGRIVCPHCQKEFLIK